MSASRRTSIDNINLIPRKYIPEKNNQIKKSISKVLPKYVVKQVKEILKRQRKSPIENDVQEQKEQKEQKNDAKSSSKSLVIDDSKRSFKRTKPNSYNNNNSNNNNATSSEVVRIRKNNKNSAGRQINRNNVGSTRTHLKDNTSAVAETMERLEKKRKEKRNLIPGTPEFFNWYQTELDRLSRAANQSDAYWRCVVELSNSLPASADIVSFYKSHLATPVVAQSAPRYTCGPVVAPAVARYPCGPVWLLSL